MEFKTADKKDVPSLKEMWKDIFNDDDGYIDLFFEYKMKSEYTFIAVENGEIAVVLVGGEEATVKKIAKFSDGIRLVPTNPAFEPIYFSNREIESLPVTIVGKVVELRAKF